MARRKKFHVHTPGPWVADKNNGCRSIHAKTIGLKLGAKARDSEICYTSGLPNDDEDRANATLIAAAPLMYNELVTLLLSLPEACPKFRLARIKRIVAAASLK